MSYFVPRLVSALVLLLTGCVAVDASINRTPLPGFRYTPPAIIPSLEFAPEELGLGVNVAVIHFNTDISMETVAVFELLLSLATEADEIIVDISSGGGDTSAGAYMSLFILQSTIPITCVVRTYAASAAFVVFQTCPTRIMEDGAQLMIHEASYAVEASDMFAEMARQDELVEFNVNMAAVACIRIKMTVEECHDKFRGGDWWMGAKEAQDIGATDKVVVSALTVLDEFKKPK